MKQHIMQDGGEPFEAVVFEVAAPKRAVLSAVGAGGNAA
jgi:hypothetical protein